MQRPSPDQSAGGMPEHPLCGLCAARTFDSPGASSVTGPESPAVDRR